MVCLCSSTYMSALAACAWPLAHGLIVLLRILPKEAILTLCLLFNNIGRRLFVTWVAQGRNRTAYRPESRYRLTDLSSAHSETEIQSDMPASSSLLATWSC